MTYFQKFKVYCIKKKKGQVPDHVLSLVAACVDTLVFQLAAEAFHRTLLKLPCEEEVVHHPLKKMHLAFS